MERIEVAPDQWTFREAASGLPFVPFGVNYTPAWSGWAPDYLSAERFDRERITADFRHMQELGVNVCKVVFSMRRMFPEPAAGVRPAPDPGTLERVDQLLQIAGSCGIRLVVTLESTWHGTPEWFDREGSWYGEGVRDILGDFWHMLASRYRGDGRVFAWSFCVEAELDRWDSPAAVEAWHEYLAGRYTSVETLNSAWNSAHASFDEVPMPFFDGRNAHDWANHPEGTDENENRTNDPFLYEFLLFREFAAVRYMHAQACAVKKADPGALCTMGFIQWNPILRSQEFHKKHESPIEGPEFNVREMARVFDYVGIHFYPVYPGGDEATQLKYLEIWSRWAYAGKPVVLEEFNMYPAEHNPRWCSTVIEQSRRYLSGWMVWAFQNVPDSDDITKVCGLLNESEELTPWGEKFKALAPEVKSWRLVREAPVRVVHADKKFLYTSGRYREFLHSLLSADSQTVDFHMESNAAVDHLIRSRSTESAPAL